VEGLDADSYLYYYLKISHTDAGISDLQSGGLEPGVVSAYHCSQLLLYTYASRTAIYLVAVFKGFLDEGCKGDLTTSHGGGLETLIITASTVSRPSFGIPMKCPCDATKYMAEDKLWDAEENIWMVNIQVSCFLKRVSLRLDPFLVTGPVHTCLGETVFKKDPVRSDFYKTYKKVLERGLPSSSSKETTLLHQHTLLLVYLHCVRLSALSVSLTQPSTTSSTSRRRYS
jgi:hypothetical protein